MNARESKILILYHVIIFLKKKLNFNKKKPNKQAPSRSRNTSGVKRREIKGKTCRQTERYGRCKEI